MVPYIFSKHSGSLNINIFVYPVRKYHGVPSIFMVFTKALKGNLLFILGEFVCTHKHIKVSYVY